MKRSIILLFAVLFVLCAVLAAAAEDVPSYWYCFECGQSANTGDTCSNCGLPRPDINENLTQIPGETDLVEVNIHRIDGSSFIKGSKNKFIYAPEKAIDDDDSTCWRFSTKKGLKDKAWLALTVEGETVDGIWIRNGNRSVSKKGKDQYPLYARLKEIRVVFSYDDRDSETMTFTLPDGNDGGWEKLDTGRHEDVYEVMVFIDSVYKGKSSKTTVCLSEIKLIQNTPAEKAAPPW